MKKIKRIAAQGDCMIIKIDSIPKSAIKSHRKGSKIIVAHSESGHHHVIERNDVVMFDDPTDPLCSFLDVPVIAELIHERSFDTHETLQIPAGKYMIRRQREWTPEGWRMVQD